MTIKRIMTIVYNMIVIRNPFFEFLRDVSPLKLSFSSPTEMKDCDPLLHSDILSQKRFR